MDMNGRKSGPNCAACPPYVSKTVAQSADLVEESPRSDEEREQALRRLDCTSNWVSRCLWPIRLADLQTPGQEPRTTIGRDFSARKK
jgi:hypothetical protein